MRRKNGFDTFKEALSRGSYDEMPMLELGIDPQVHLSRNRVPQPFFLICGEDSVLAQMSGAARIEFRDSSVNYFDAATGDFVYVPAGTPHRIMPKSESVHIRYKAAEPTVEGVAWYSEQTGREISRVMWNCGEELPQDGYLRACRAFNADATLRTCPTTGAKLPEIDLAPFHWAEVAIEVREAEAAELERARKKGVALRVSGSARGSHDLTIKRAPAERVPLKTNAYAFARMAPSGLSPLFPYFAPGCIVPGSTMFGAKQGSSGYFVHHNDVDEVVLCMGTDGVQFQFPGMVRVGPLIHPVGTKPGQESRDYKAALTIITQRQLVGKPQRESVLYFCQKCESEIARIDYDADAFPGTLDGPVDSEIAGLGTITHSAAFAIGFNESVEQRTCKNCGHVNPPYPIEWWGWEDYLKRTPVAVKLRKSLIEKAAAEVAQVNTV